MAVYADSERGYYPVWQSLDHPDFFPGSGILFVTVTVSDHHLIRLGPLKIDLEIAISILFQI